MKTNATYTEWLKGLNHLIYQEKAMTQVKLASLARIDKGYVNSILAGRKHASVHLQDAISHALGMTHRDVRNVGREALGLPKIVEARQCVHLIYGAADETPASSTSVTPHPAQIAVANGDGNQVANSVQAAPVMPASGGDIARELCGLIAEHLADKNMDEQIAFRAKVKRCIEGE